MLSVLYMVIGERLKLDVAGMGFPATIVARHSCNRSRMTRRREGLNKGHNENETEEHSIP